jgi:hypothetical protein
MTSADALLDRPSPKRVASDLLLAIAFGWFAYVVSCWLVAPHLVPVTFGTQWQTMSEDPFKLFGQFPHRILVPVLAWMFGQGGEGYLGFTHVLHMAMLAATFFACRRFQGAVLDAVLVTLAIAITAPVQMYKVHWVGFADPACYTLFLLMLVAARNPYVLWSLFLINLFNHEMAAFFLPWLWFLRRRQDRRWRLDAICAAAAIAIYAGFYFYVKGAAQQTYSVDYFMANPLFPGGTFVVWNLAAVHWIVAFGPVLALLAWHQHRKGTGGDRWHLWLVLLCILTVFCIAFDWARHSNLLLLPLVIASVAFLASGNKSRIIYAVLLVLSAFLFWWKPPWAADAWPTKLLANLPLLVTTEVVHLTPPPAEFESFGTLEASLQKWLPAIWKPLAVIYAIGISIWCAGWAYARHQNRAAS